MAPFLFNKNRITTYTRFEPPVFNDTYAGKIILDCGYDLESFNKKKFEDFQIKEELVDGGSQLFFGCMREDYLSLDERTFSPPQMWCADDDLHLRYKLLGFEHKVSSAHVYHFVSKTSRFSDEYKTKTQQFELNSNRNFIRKWGHFVKHDAFMKPIIPHKYDIGFRVTNCSVEMLATLEPWCSAISSDASYSKWLDEEQKHTILNLFDRIKPWNAPLNNDITVEFDASKLTQESFITLTQLPDIITQSGEIGEFELDIFNISIAYMDTYEHNLVHIYNK